MAYIVSDGAVMGLIGGADVELDQFRRVLSITDNWIAVDGGADHCLAVDLKPSAVIGDLDSLSHLARDKFAGLLCHISEQDTTDFEKTVSRVSAKAFVAMGFTGGRLDHTLSVLGVLARYPDQRILLLDQADVSFLAPANEIILDIPVGTRIGLMPLADVVVTATGLTWPLDAAAMHPIGMVSSSNQVAQRRVTIAADGPLLVTVPPTQLAAVLKAVVPAQ